MEEIVIVLGNNIKKLRKERNWTQEYLAEQAGISVPFMTQIELARKQASLEVIEKIAKAFNVPYSRLFIQSLDTKYYEEHNNSCEEFIRKLDSQIKFFLSNNNDHN